MLMLVGAVEVIKAAKASDNTALDRNVAAAHVNAQQIADFVSLANKHWPQAGLRDLPEATWVIVEVHCPG
ncbi:MAG: hypothetical protein GX886_02150, partial [Comamonadaceae bacterium]|nr:hypothetical protein [Comamonadaceae bacterium]